MDSLKVFAPASLSNLAVGFDILSLALEGIGDELKIKKVDKKGLHFGEIHGAKGALSYNIMENIAGYGAQKLLEHLGEADMPLQLELHKKMRIGTGLGSSAASAVAGVMAVNELLGRPLSKKELLPFALEAERMIDPNLPADNVAASLYGGIVVLKDKDGSTHKRLPLPKGLSVVVIQPFIKITSKESRTKLKTQISLEQHIAQSGNLAMFISAMYSSDFVLLKESMVDHIIEEQRANDIPHYYELKEIAMQQGALGFNISGSGPSMFALIDNSLNGENIKEGISKFLKSKKIKHDCFISAINQEGAIRC